MKTQRDLTLVCIASLLLVCVLKAQQPGGGSAPWPADSLRPNVNDSALLQKLIVALESGPQAGQITVRTATADGATFLPGRSNRGRWAMQNTSGESVWYGFTPGVTDQSGWMVPAGSSTGGSGTAAIYVYSASGTARVTFSEGVWQ